MPLKENETMSLSGNSNFSFNKDFNISANNYINPHANNNTIDNNNNYNNTKSEKNFYLSANDFKNQNAFNENAEITVSSQGKKPDEAASFKTYEITKEVVNDDNIIIIGESKALKREAVKQDNIAEKNSNEIDLMIKEALEKAGFANNEINAININTNNNSSSEHLVYNKYYSSSTGQSFDNSKTSNANIPAPQAAAAYQKFSKTYHATTVKFPTNTPIDAASSADIKTEINKPLIIPSSSYESHNQKETVLLSDSGLFSNYVNAVATNELSTNNNLLYNELLTFKDNPYNSSNSGIINLLNTNNYNTNLSYQNYTFENQKTEDHISIKTLEKDLATAQAEKNQPLNNLLSNSSSNQQFKASEAIGGIKTGGVEEVKKLESSAAKPENNNNNFSNNYNSIAITSLKKNEDLTFASNSRKPKNTAESAKEAKEDKEIRKIPKAKNTYQENNYNNDIAKAEKKDDYISTTQNTISNFHKEYLTEEDFQNLQFELGKTSSKELCGAQVNIVSKYTTEHGKVLTNMLPGILSNINPVNRMDAFKILVANIHDWPNDESHFNGIICFLPSANQKEAIEIVKRTNRNNCCCSVF